MVRNSRESDCIHHQQDQFIVLFVNCFLLKIFSQFVTRERIQCLEKYYCNLSTKKSTTHRDSMLTYLTRRQGVGLRQQLEKQIQDECDYWEHVLRCVLAAFVL